jgi:hypothetical protein
MRSALRESGQKALSPADTIAQVPLRKSGQSCTLELFNRDLLRFVLRELLPSHHTLRVLN